MFFFHNLLVPLITIRKGVMVTADYPHNLLHGLYYIPQNQFTGRSMNFGGLKFFT